MNKILSVDVYRPDETVYRYTVGEEGVKYIHYYSMEVRLVIGYEDRQQHLTGMSLSITTEPN